MKENENNFSKETREYIPTLEEVQTILAEVIGKEFTEVRRREDGEGIYLLEVSVPGEAEGECAQYAYRRKGQYAESRTTVTGIDVTYYDSEGMPVGGTSVAELKDGTWQFPQ